MSSQPIQFHHHHHPATQYIHYNPPHLISNPQQNIGIDPRDTQHQHQLQPQQQHVHYTQHYQQIPQQQAPITLQQQLSPPLPQPVSQPQASTSSATSSTSPLVATGDWTKDLVHLAKTAELKCELRKHALTLQLHTAHILSAHASLQEKSRTIQDIKEQKNKLESERMRLLNALREVNEDKDKADMLEAKIERECQDLRSKMTQLTDGEYATAKNDVDRLRQELGQPPLPSLQSTLDEKAAQYLNERRLTGPTNTNSPSPAVNGSISSGAGAGTKRGNADLAGGSGAGAGGSSGGAADGGPATKRPRGRPKGSKNRTKEGGGY